ncbi:MAG: VWA domain-containing protein [Deltaproteobacteria bacterium]|nr:VWA domain-containing protein [Deltaproteobacteria bacterium]
MIPAELASQAAAEASAIDGLGLGGWVLRNPGWLLLLLLLPLLGALRTRRSQEVLVLPFVARWAGTHDSKRSHLAQVLVVLGLVFLTLAMARPQRVEKRHFVQQEGYDIVLAIDLSGSMLAEDYKRMGRRINRIQAIVPIIEAFMDRRSNDRIGVVAFGGRAYTLAPLSFDHAWLRKQVSRLQVGLVEDGTAIGDALALAVSRLGQAEREQEGQRLGGFIILLTDGANNSGTILPAKAAELAAAKGIPVYTIGAGKEGLVPMPVYNEQGQLLGYRNVRSDLDEETLQGIAEATSGAYFRAMDADTVDAAFAAIDQSNKIEFEAKSNLTAHELYPFVAWPGLACTALAFALARPGAKEGGA